MIGVDHFRLSVSIFYIICRRVGRRRILIFLDSSMVEYPAVNRVVAGSSPARGAMNIKSRPG